MKRKNGFTLIELLVVIAIIALLMSILMPSLTRVRKNAKTTICIMNLRTWGLMIQMYAEDNNGSTHGVHVEDTAWQNAYRDWYENEPKIRCCPEAVKLGAEGAKQPYAAWGGWATTGTTPLHNFKASDYGSYGENGWTQNGKAWNEYAGQGGYWKTPYVKNASNVPAFLGCNWIGGFVNGFRVGEEAVYAPEYSGGPGGGQIDRYMMDRHSGYLGSSFLDGSARKVGLKELFRVKWHRRYDINKWYETQEQNGWPKWMANFKDY